MKAIHWRIKVTYNVEKRFTKSLTWDDARRKTDMHPPGHRYFKGQIFLKTRPKMMINYEILAVSQY